MKLLILLVLGALSLCGLGPVSGASAVSDPRGESGECHATVECTPQGTCLVVCYDEDGKVCCSQEIDCDQPCDSPCEPGPGCSPKR